MDPQFDVPPRPHDRELLALPKKVLRERVGPRCHQPPLPLRRLHLPQRQEHVGPCGVLRDQEVARLHLPPPQLQRQELEWHPRKDEVVLLQPRVEHVQHLERTRVHRVYPLPFHAKVLPPPIGVTRDKRFSPVSMNSSSRPVW